MHIHSYKGLNPGTCHEHIGMIYPDCTRLARHCLLHSSVKLFSIVLFWLLGNAYLVFGASTHIWLDYWFKAVFTLQQKSSDSCKNCIRICCLFTQGKNIWASCMLRVYANNAFLYKNGPKSSKLSLKVALDNRKISSHSLFITACKKLSHINKKDFSGVLAFRIQSIQFLFRIHIYPDSWAIQRLSIPNSLV